MTKLKDVAREAQVSISTVSRVLNEPELVRSETRAHVQRVIEALNYQPSRVARRLRLERGQARLIGLVIPDLQNPFFADVARGVEDVTQAHGYVLILSNSDEDKAKTKLSLEAMRAESVDGIIVPPLRERCETVAELIRSGIPVVCIDRRLARTIVDTVVVDNVHGAYEAVEHLIQLGHRRIGFIEGLPHLSTSRDRLRGYRQALADHGIAPDEALVRQGDSRQESGRHLAGELLERADRPTALFVGNNLMTLGALEAIHLRGLRIPEEVAIVGYDDMPWALALNPPLTAVRQPGYEIGYQAAALLLQRIKEPGRSAKLVVLQPELVVRRSCGARLDEKRTSQADLEHNRRAPKKTLPR